MTEFSYWWEKSVPYSGSPASRGGVIATGAARRYNLDRGRLSGRLLSHANPERSPGGGARVERGKVWVTRTSHLKDVPIPWEIRSGVPRARSLRSPEGAWTVGTVACGMRLV